MCGFSDALNSGHTVEQMQQEGFSLHLNDNGTVTWTVGTDGNAG